LEEILDDFADRPDFLTYAEDIKAKVQPALLRKHATLLMSVYKEFPKLSFTQQDMMAVFEVVAAKQQGKWPRELTASEMKDFKKKMALRFRTS